MAENPEAVLLAEREAARRSRAKRRRAALTGASVTSALGGSVGGDFHSETNFDDDG
jgi:hypothetical protein